MGHVDSCVTWLVAYSPKTSQYASIFRYPVNDRTIAVSSAHAESVSVSLGAGTPEEVCQPILDDPRVVDIRQHLVTRQLTRFEVNYCQIQKYELLMLRQL